MTTISHSDHVKTYPVPTVPMSSYLPGLTSIPRSCSQEASGWSIRRRTPSIAKNHPRAK